MDTNFEHKVGPGLSRRFPPRSARLRRRARLGVAMVTAMTLGFLAMAGLEAGRVGPWLVYSAGMLASIAGSALAVQRVA